MKKLLLSLLLIVLGTGAMAQQKIQFRSADKAECVKSDMKGLKASISFSSLEATNVETKSGEFSELHIEGAYSNGNVGEPALPMFTRLIAIPTGATPVVEVGAHSETQYKLSDYGIGTVSAMQAPVHKNIDPNSIEYTVNRAAYTRDSYNEDPLAMVEVLGTMRGITLGRLIVQPVRYNPAAGTVMVYNDIEVSVDFENGDAAGTEQMFSNTISPAFQSVYDQIFNIDMLMGSNAKDAYTDHPDLYNTPVKMLVICYSGFKNNAALNSWLEWKLQKGYYVDIFYTDETGTTATNIKNFIKTKYNASVSAGNAYTYLIVIGDTGQVPQYMTKTIDSDIGQCASDLGYAAVNFTTSSTTNYFPDMYYSRISVENTTHLTNYINKVLTYEKFEFADGGNYLNNVILVGGWDSNWTSRVAKPTINYGKNNYFNTSNTTYGGFGSGTISATISTSTSQGYSGSNNGVYKGINNGVCLLNYTAHGDKQEWQGPQFTAKQVETLTNTGKYFFGIGNCCLTGNFNLNNANYSSSYAPSSSIGQTACFAETMIRVPNAGAIAYIGCSPYSYWYEDFYWAVGAHSYSQGNAPSVSASSTGVYDAMFTDENWNSASSLLYLGNLAVQQAVTNGNTTSSSSMGGDVNNSAHYYFQFYHCFGDGSIMPYITKPEANTVSNMPSTVTPGTNSITLNAVAGSYVAVTDNSSKIYGVGVANSSGVATVNFTEAIPGNGTLYVAVTRQQYQPWFGTIEVVGGTQYDITTNVSPDNAGTVEGAGQYYSGVTCTLTATPNTGYAFNNWNDGNTTNPRTITVTGNATYTANFRALEQHSISYNAQQTHGTISVSPTNAYMGDIVTLAATPDNGYVLDHWDVNTVSKGVSNRGNVTVTNNQFTMPDSEVTISAVFRTKKAVGDYELVTASQSDWSGDYVIAYVASNTSATVMTTRAGSGNRTYATGTSFTIDASTNTLAASDVASYNVTIAKDGNYYTLKFGNYYLGATNGNYLLFSTTTPSQDTYRWTISYSNGTLTIANASYTTRTLQWNNSNPRFACYTSSQKAISLFKKIESNCSAPTNLAVNYSNGSTATVTWSGDVSSYNIDVNGAVTNGVTSPYTLSNLQPLTAYTIKVQSDCGDEQSAWATAGSFTTPCGAFAIPYSYGFEDSNDFTCWTTVNCETCTSNSNMYGLFNSSSYAHNGSKLFIFSSYCGETDPQYLISPELSDVVNGVHVEFYYENCSFSSAPETFQVGYSTTTNDVSSFTWVDSKSNTAQTYQHFTANYMGNVKYIAVKYTSQDSYYLLLDDFIFEEAPSCLEPTNVVASNETTTSATISWTAGGSESAWDLYYTTNASDVPGASTTPSISGITTTSRNLTGLTPATTYYVYVRSACNGSETSTWSLGIFNTECEGMSLPYTYGFEDGALSVCWTTINETPVYMGIEVSNTAANTGTYHLNMDRRTPNDIQIAVLPEVSGALNTCEMSFYARLHNGGNSNYTTSGRTLAVGVMTDPDDVSTFVQVGSTISPTASYAKYTVDFSGYTGNGHYIAIQHYSTSSNNGYTFIDDLEVIRLSTCATPTNLIAGTPGTHDVQLSWTENGEATSWQICVNGDENNLITANTNVNFNLTGLNPGTDYTVKVRSDCGDDQSGWSNAVSFTTLESACLKPTNMTASNLTINTAHISWDGNADSYNVQYATATVTGTALDPVFEDGFESGLGNWTTYANGYDNTNLNWQTFDASQFDSGSNHGGSYSAMSRSWTSTTGDQNVDNWLVTPQMTLGNTLRFWVCTNGQFPDSYAVYVSTGSGVVPSSGTGDFTVISNLTPATGEWVEKTYDLSAYAGQQGYVAIRHKDNAKDHLLVDDFGVYNTINTYSYGTWQTVTPSPTTTSCDISGLSAETLYAVQVQADCGSPDGTSGWSSVYFTTPDACSAPTDLVSSNITAATATLGWSDNQDSYNVRHRKVYFYEGFEGETMPTGWTTIDANNDGNCWQIGSAKAHSGANGAYNISYIYQNTGISPDDYLVSPLLDLKGTLRVWLTGNETTNYAEHFAIYLSTTGNTASDFTTTLVAESTTTNSYVEYTADLSSYEGQQGYIAIRHFNCTDQREIYVDDFGLYGTENWVSVNPNPTDATTTLTGLQSNTGYEWQVQGNNCDGNGNTTIWSDVANFTTLIDINVVANPTEGGTVAGGGSYSNGASVTVTATANSGYEFVNWTENGSQVSDDASYNFTVTSSRNLVANFVRMYTITVTANPTAGGNVTGGGTYTNGDEVTLTATANTGYTFINWTVDGTPVENAGATYTFNASADGNYVANFAQMYTVTASVDPEGTGTVIGAGTYAEGSEVTLTATANGNYTFSNWTLNGTEVSGATAVYTFTMSAATAGAYVAHFTPMSYAISVTANPAEGGTVTGAGTYNYNGTATLTATANPGYTFTGWADGETANTRTVTVTGAASYVANFKLVDYTISMATVTGGTLSSDPTSTAHIGDVVTLSATANTGYTFNNDWVVTNTTNNETVTVTNGQFTMPASNVSVTASFTLNSHDLTINYMYNGTAIATAYTDNLDFGEAYSVTSPVIEGYTADQLVVEGNMIDEDVTVTVNYTINQYTVTASATTGGTVTGDGTYDYGTVITLSAIADANYDFVNWTENGIVVSTEAVYSFEVTTDRILVANFERSTVDQEVTLVQGWNWFVPTVSITLEQLETALGTNGLQITSQESGFVTYEEEEWGGTLEALVPGQVYNIQVIRDCSFTLVGNPITSVTIDIKPGYNWIGYIGSQPISIENAFRSINPVEGDSVNTFEEGFSTFEEGEWGGTFNQLEPAHGYIYYSNDTQTKQLIFQGSK